MKLSGFFKLVKRKINKYDKYAQNPFVNSKPLPITIIWVEDDVYKEKNDFKKPYL